MNQFSINERICGLLKDLGNNLTIPTCYDTLWLLHLPEKVCNYNLNSIISFISDHQNQQGAIGHYKDIQKGHIITTIFGIYSIINTLKRDLPNSCKKRLMTILEKAKGFINLKLPVISTKPEPISYDLLLLNFIRKIENNDNEMDFSFLTSKDFRKKVNRKFEYLKDMKVNHLYNYSFSVELFNEYISRKQLEKLRLPNGSLGCSPSATVFFLTRNKKNNAKSIEYINDCIIRYRGLTCFFPFETFEYNWVCHYLLEAFEGKKEIIHEYLALLSKYWTKSGVGFTKEWGLPDGDSTAVLYYTLKKAGFKIETPKWSIFESQNNFRTYPLESHPSLITQLNFLSALNLVNNKSDEERKEKLGKFIRNLSFPPSSKEPSWIDKYNYSIFYAVERLLNAYQHQTENFPFSIEKLLEWLLYQQSSEGMWGTIYKSNYETALAIISLCKIDRYWNIDTSQSLRDYLNNINDIKSTFNVSTWLGKGGIYNPILVNETVVTSAIMMSRNILNCKIHN